MPSVLEKTKEQISASEKLKQIIGFKPHLKQQHILATMKRYNILDAGRRFGKTILTSYIAIKNLLKHEQQIWVVAPTYGLTEKVWNYLMKYIAKFPAGSFKIERSKMKVTCVATGSWLECKSADNPESLLGEGLNLIIFDEASKVNDDSIWEQYLKPTLLDRKGSAIFISTPSGKNWFYRLWINAKTNPQWARWKYPSRCNPYLDPEELEEIKRNTPQMVWQQEWMGDFIEGAGQVFREVRSCIFGALQERAEGHAATDRWRYIIGWDTAKVQDYSVITVIDRALRQVVYFDRFKDLDWNIQKNRVKEVCNKFGKGRIIMDSTNRESLVEDLRRDGYQVEGMHYSASLKRELIHNLQIKLEKWEIRYPAIPELLDELEAFSVVITHAGNVRYTAPSGSHDDCVNSLALACWGMGNMRYIPPYESGKGEGNPVTKKSHYVKVY